MSELKGDTGMSDMILGKRARGRPKGSEIDDTKTLLQVAAMLVSTPNMLPMTAMKRVLGRPTDATLHRVNRKWRERGERLLIAAREEWRQRESKQKVAQIAEAIDTVGGSIQRALKDPKVRTWADVLIGATNDPKFQAWLERTRRALRDPKVRVLAGRLEKTHFPQVP